jgi:dienelactone hydrolase
MMMQEWFSEGFPVQVPAGASILDAEMQVPAGSNGLIVLAHAGGKPRLTQRIQNVAEYFIRDGFGILIMDLLTEEETEVEKQAEEDGLPGGGDACFEAEMLAERLDDSLGWVRDLPEASGLPLGLFGAGPGASAALTVAASRPDEVGALVITGLSRPADMRVLRHVRAPTLLIAGEPDGAEADFVRECIAAVQARKRLEFLAGYPNGWGETRAIEKVSRLACNWYEQNLP